MGKIKKALKWAFKRYGLDALSAMALGLFASLIIGLILSQISRIPFLSFIGEFANILSASSPIVGSAIGVAVAYGLKSKPLVVFHLQQQVPLAIPLCQQAPWVAL